MIEAPALTMPDFTKAFTIETNASGHRMGAILMQDERPFPFLSKAFGPKTVD